MEKVKKVTLSGMLFAIGHDPAVLHRPDPGSWKNAPAMNGWKHTTI